MGGTDRRMRNMKLITQICNAKYGVALFLLCYVVVCQMVFNIDSYLYANTGHHDSAIFFQCGKFLMNGYTPYVDFADSKGLLLWIIYLAKEGRSEIGFLQISLSQSFRYQH